MHQAEQFMLRAALGLVEIALEIGWAAGQCFTRQGIDSHLIIPVDAERNALAFDFKLDLCSLTRKVFEAAHVLPLRTGFSAILPAPTFNIGAR